LQSEAGGVGAVLGTEFLHDAGDVEFHGVFADVKVAGDDLVGVALDQFLHHLNFAGHVPGG
jgi:hypothetical protein